MPDAITPTLDPPAPPLLFQPDAIPTERAAADKNFFDDKVLLRLRMRCFGDKQKVDVDDENIQSPADKEYLHLSSDLFQSEKYDDIKSHMGATKQFVTKRSTPSYFAGGVHVLGMRIVDTVDMFLTQQAAGLPPLVERFLREDWESVKSQSRIALVSLYDEDKYPPPEVVRGRFEISWQLFTLGTPERLKKELFARENAKLVATLQSATELQTALLAAELNRRTQGLVEKLRPGPDGKKKALKDQAIISLREYLQLVEDSTSNEQLTAVIAATRKALMGANPDYLRKDKDVRATVADELGKVAETLSGFITVAPVRKIIKLNGANGGTESNGETPA